MLPIISRYCWIKSLEFRIFKVKLSGVINGGLIQKKGLLNNHQVIFFYSKTSHFKFNRIYTDYSETTNIDQILQERVRNEKGKAVYKYNADGDFVIATDNVLFYRYVS